MPRLDAPNRPFDFILIFHCSLCFCIALKVSKRFTLYFQAIWAGDQVPRQAGSDSGPSSFGNQIGRVASRAPAAKPPAAAEDFEEVRPLGRGAFGEVLSGTPGPIFRPKRYPPSNLPKGTLEADRVLEDDFPFGQPLCPLP